MSRTVLFAALGLLVAATGCTPSAAPQWQPDGLAYRLRTLKDVYFEYEPLDLTLIATNPSLKALPMPLTDSGGTVIIHKITDNDEVAWKPREVAQGIVGEDVMPGEVVDIRLTDRQGLIHLSAPGTWVVQYRFFHNGGRNNRLYVSTENIFLQCAPQPLSLPADTPKPVADAMTELLSAPAWDFISHRPAWTQVNYSEPMRKIAALGPAALPALLANINHYKIQPAVIQILADMKAAPAVPKLLGLLAMDDRLLDSLALTALAKITENPKGFDYYTHWSDGEVQKQALAAYRLWWAKNR